MSSVVVEFASWPASEAYKADRTLIYPALNVISGVKGVQKIYYGIQHEDQATALMLIFWEKLAAHEALIADKLTYGQVVATLTPVVSGGLTLHHVKFVAPEAVPAQFGAPVTEVVIQTIKDISKAAELDAHLAAVTIFSAGKSVEHERQWVLVKGWQSIEEHHAYVKEKLSDWTSVLAGLVDIDVKHYKLTPFKL